MQVAAQGLPLTTSLEEKAAMEMEGGGREATHAECAESVISTPGHGEPKKAWLALSKAQKGKKKGIYKYQEKVVP